MSYCTQNGLTPGDIMPAKMDQKTFLQLTTENDVFSPDAQTIVDKAISDADALIDSYRGGKNADANVLRSYSSIAATYYLYNRRNVGVPENIRQDYEDLLSFLRDVAKGIATFGAFAPPSNAPGISVKIKSSPRMFSNESLRDF